MGAITVRMSEAMQAYVEAQAAEQGYADGEAFLQALIMDHHARHVEALHAALAEGLASGPASASAEAILAAAARGGDAA
ncbi:ribbon-helix-helix domain-containing protein [Sphingomonas morindae]|uniref:CopG family transcriptional regulator n=1 Tax=Sphingomonas morindae TaxID=1541170 RepID=A0ABY4X4S9_9SPHN|nr:hypothetical protein [Sphingomonas morindae]USI71890.1 hypothetical protein LHA26_11225 [Sphingomonas morindae]